MNKKILIIIIVLSLLFFMVAYFTLSDRNNVNPLKNQTSNKEPNSQSDKKDKVSQFDEKDSNNKDDSNNLNKKDENKVNKEEKKESKIKEEKVESYFPIEENTKYIYEGISEKDRESLGYDTYISYTKGNKVQRRVETLVAGVSVEVIEVKDGKITRIYNQPISVSARNEAYRENIIRDDVLNFVPANEDERDILLKEPIKKGNSWKIYDHGKRTITSTSSKIDVLGKPQNAIEVTTEEVGGFIVKDYYVKDIGLVKKVHLTPYESGIIEESSTLKEIKRDYTFTQKIKFYYVNIDDDRFMTNNESDYNLFYKEREVQFRTNDITRKMLEEAYKKALEETDNEQEVVFTKNTKINNLYLNRDGMVYLDLNKAFVDEVNIGSVFESMRLQCVAATFGNYYGIDKVLLTIDGKNFESGKIVFKNGEHIDVQDGIPVE